MKTIEKQITIGFLVLISATLFLPMACQQEDVVPKVNEEIRELNSVSSAVASFTIKSTNLKETDNGYEFTGTLGSKDSEGEDFEIGTGDFKVVLSLAGDVESVAGTGTPAFPNVGVFAELLKEFTFKNVLSRIEYEKGDYYKTSYNTDIPLNDDTRYVHFQVLNESKDGSFELRHKINSVIYNFSDLYIDPNDPALFFKMQLWKPGKSPNPNGVITKFWQRIVSKLKAAGKEAVKFSGAPGMIFGISNQARFKTTEYDFSITDKETFKALYGFDRFESLNSHLYIKLKNIPIPETVVLRLSGEMYIHEPVETLVPSPEEVKEKRLNAFLDWFREGDEHGKMATFNGSMDPGGKGIGLILQGVLPKLNDVLGRDIFNDELNLDILGATLQYQMPRIDELGNGSSFLRFGGQVRVPLLQDILGEGIKKYLISPPSPNSFVYFSVGPELDDASFFIESADRLYIPFHGETEFLKNHFLINKDGINFSGNVLAPIGPLTLSKEVKGQFSKDSYELETTVDKDIILPNGVVLGSKDLNVKISSVTGLTVKGGVMLPFGLGESEVTGQLNEDGLTLEGSLKAGTEIDLGNGLMLPSAGMSFSVSTDPDKGIYLKGKLQVPHGVGYVDVEGYLMKGDFSLHGVVNRDLILGGVNFLSKSGELTISKSEGIYFKTILGLGTSFGNRMLEGHITAQGIDLSGSFNGGIPIGGHTFSFASGKILASSTAGVSITGNINLYVFAVSVTGKFTGKNAFTLTGTTNYNSNLFKAGITCDVKPTSVTLSGTGTVYIYRPIPGRYDPVYTGAMSFNPNWSAHTVSACYSNICFGL